MRDEEKTREQIIEELKVLRDSYDDVKRIEADCLEWKGIFNNITDMITIHDADFNIIEHNDAAKKILGLPAIALNTVKCFEYYHGSERPPEECPSCQCLRTGEPASFEIFEPHLNMFIEIRAIPRLDEKGDVAGLIHIARDITQRKRAEDELQRYRAVLEDLVDDRTAELRGTVAKLHEEIAERTRAEEERKKLIAELQEALASVKALSGLLPICAWCKNIRDDRGYWDKVEAYIEVHSEATFTHGICPDCMKKHYPEMLESPDYQKAVTLRVPEEFKRKKK